MIPRCRAAALARRVYSVVAFMLVCQGSLYAIGLPGEYLVSDRWRTLLSGYSPIPNAAFMTEANYLSVHGVYAQTLNTFNKADIGVVVPIGLYQTAAFSWLMLGTASFESYDNFVQSAKKINANDNYFVLSYAINPWRRLGLGLNLNLAYQNLYDEKQKFGIGADLGLSYRLTRHPLMGDHLLGLAWQNILPPIMFPQEDSGTFKKELLASSLKFSLLSSWWEKRIESSVDYALKNLYETATLLDTTGKEEALAAADKLEWELNLMAGTWILRIVKLHVLLGLSDVGLAYGGFAAGFNIPSVNAGRDLSFLYQFIRVQESKAKTHGFYLRVDLGKHREEIYARRMARLLNIAPNDLYTRALTLYSAGKYWDAYFVFGQVAVEFPDFFKRDWVAYYMASCLEHLDMRESATNDYSAAKTEYPKSTIVPYADLGQMRIYYRQSDLNSVEMQFNRLTQPGVPDSLMYHAYYLMGEAQMKAGEYRKAKQLFESVPPSHPEYLFAQHSLAVVSALSGTFEEALGYLKTCINSVPRTDAQQEIINRSLVFIGYIYYEQSEMQGALSQAVTALRSIPKTSYYYEDALLGLAWTGLRARQWQDCIDAGQLLVTTSKRPPLQAEGALVKAYAHMMRKEYPTAVDLLADALRRLEAYSAPTAEDVDARQKLYQGVRTSYDEVALRTRELAQLRQSQQVLRSVDSLHEPQKGMKEQIDSNLVFFDEATRNTFFSRGVPTVKEDIEYALAVAKKLAGGGKAAEAAKGGEERQKEIDQEIERLKQQMQDLNKDGGGGTPEEKK